MSDYVSDALQACFDPPSTAMDLTTLASAVEQPIISATLDEIDWDELRYEDLASVDWKALHEEIMHTVVEQPNDRMVMWAATNRYGQQSVLEAPFLDQSIVTSATSGQLYKEDQNNEPSLDGPSLHTCHVAGCKARPFKRRGDLKRHSQKHEPQQIYICSAIDCDRRGSKGFSRRDKLFDHMLAGHDETTIFTCSACKLHVPRDLMPAHTPSNSGNLAYYRTCPLPRCSFKVHAGGYNGSTYVEALNGLQSHLSQKHDVKARFRFADLLKQRGYDAETCNVICPICVVNHEFQNHQAFYEHFMDKHFHGPTCSEHADAACSCFCPGRLPSWRFPKSALIPDEVRRHCRAILSVLPDFKQHPVWADIKCNQSST